MALVVGIHIPSYRPIVSYQRIEHIPTAPKTNLQHFQEFQQMLFQTYGSANIHNPGIVLKQSLVSMAVFGYGNQAVLLNEEYRTLFEKFE
ncbi:MAG: hypothetical protein ABFS56_20125 [Pseudomonadota bacterium]